jgi:hypothetical protein
MTKKKETETSLRPEITRELNKVKQAKEETEKVKKAIRPKKEKILEQMQKARVKDVERKILRDPDYDKHKKADKKIGGVRGKFRPSLERTRKRT